MAGLTRRQVIAAGILAVPASQLNLPWGARPAAAATGASLFAGHVPGRVMVGMAAPLTGRLRPLYPEAYSIVDRPLAERRIFTSGPITTAAANKLLSHVDEHPGQFGVISFKHNKDIASGAIAAGRMDGTLDLLAGVAKARRASAGGSGVPFAAGINHEPSGDSFPLANWAAAQKYCSNYFAGIKGGVYSPRRDVRDIMAWASIHNGFHWADPKRPDPECAIGHPQSLIDTYRRNGSILMADFYEATPPPARRSTAVKIQSFIAWHRARNSGALGCGEWSCVTDEGHRDVWDVMKANADLWVISNVFNSSANSRWEWRLIPDSYPATSGVVLDDYGPEVGGTAQTEANLIAFQGIVDDSGRY